MRGRSSNLPRRAALVALDEVTARGRKTGRLPQASAYCNLGPAQSGK